MDAPAPVLARTVSVWPLLVPRKGSHVLSHEGNSYLCPSSLRRSSHRNCFHYIHCCASAILSLAIIAVRDSLLTYAKKTPDQLSETVWPYPHIVASELYSTSGTGNLRECASLGQKSTADLCSSFTHLHGQCISRT